MAVFRLTTERILISVNSTTTEVRLTHDLWHSFWLEFKELDLSDDLSEYRFFLFELDNVSKIERRYNLE